MKKTALLFVLLLAATLSAQTTLPAHVPTNGLIGFWRMDGTGQDLSSHQNHADTTHMAWSYDLHGNAHGTAAINGDSTSMLIVNNISGVSSNKKTFSAWFMLPSNLQATNKYNPLFTATDGTNRLYCHVFG